MAQFRDVGAFEARAASYEYGRLGRLHHQISERNVDLALRAVPAPREILDVGCGTGYSLRLLAERCESAVELIGVDPAPAMIAVAEAASNDPRLQLLAGIGAEHLPFEDATFDLVLATTSFDHWSDQRAGLLECARVLRGAGRLVLVDQFSLLLTPTLLTARRGRARTKRRAARLIRAAGFTSLEWHRLYSPLIRAVVAGRD